MTPFFFLELVLSVSALSFEFSPLMEPSAAFSMEPPRNEVAAVAKDLSVAAVTGLRRAREDEGMKALEVAAQGELQAKAKTIDGTLDR